MINKDTDNINRVYLEQIQQPGQLAAKARNLPAIPVAPTANQQVDPGQLLQQVLNPSTSVENFVNFLQSNQDQRVRAVLLAGRKDGDPQDEVLTVAKDRSLLVSKLKPTQNQIGVDESIFNLFNNKYKYNSLPKILEGNNLKLGKPGDDKILAYSNGSEFFVLDGHHRWSQIFVGNPKATAVCDVIQGKLTAAQILKAVHSAIYADVGATNTITPQGKNLLDPGDYNQEIHNQKVGEFLDEEYRQVWAKQGYDDDIKIANFTWNNILLMRKNGTAQGAPERRWMPQPGHNNADQYQDLLKKGIINFNQPKTADMQNRSQVTQAQTIAASFEYKGDSKLLWEVYQDILPLS